MSNETFKLTSDQIELLDLYCVGALEKPELESAEKLLQESEIARDYVDEARTMFAQFEDNTEPDEELLAKIKLKIKENESDNGESSNVVTLNKKQNTFWMPFVSGAIAASVLALVFATAFWPTSQDNNDSAFRLEDQLQVFSAQPNTKQVSLASDGGNVGANVVLNEQGDIMIDARDIEALSEDETYQLWAIVETQTGQQVISAGVLGNGPGIYMTRVNGNISAFAITQEPKGGVEKSSNAPSYQAVVAS